jgi:hypothetical protein
MNLRRCASVPRIRTPMSGYPIWPKLYLGAYEEALDLYRRAKELNPNYPYRTFHYGC